MDEKTFEEVLKNYCEKYYSYQSVATNVDIVDRLDLKQQMDKARVDVLAYVEGVRKENEQLFDKSMMERAKEFETVEEERACAFRVWRRPPFLCDQSFFKDGAKWRVSPWKEKFGRRRSEGWKQNFGTSSL